MSTLSSAEEFHDLIRHECKLADRHGQRFSLVVVEIGTADENSAAARHLVRTLYKRFRTIDDVGWFSRHQIGVFLPYTNARGAFRLAEDVAETVSKVTPVAPFTIYTYPSQNWPVLPKFDWRQLRPSRLLAQLTVRSTIRSSVDFRSLLALERDRADRNGHVFSLALLDVNKIEAQGISINRLTHQLNLRLRLTDVIGWYDEDDIGLLLPYASKESALAVIDKLSQENRIPFKQHCAVYTYPTQWLPGTHADPAHPGRERREPSGSDPAQAMPPPPPAAALASSEPPPPPVPAQRAAPEDEPAAGGEPEAPPVTPAREFDPFVVRSIPLWKRGMDIVGASVGIAATSWLMIPIVLAIKLQDNGPVIYKGTRSGLGGRPFPFYKFRTMVMGADKLKSGLAEQNERTGPVFKMQNDPRVTPLGRFLRKWSLDELPQFFNVLAGDMSLVGPRPPTPDEVSKYYNWHDKRLEIKPGITCLWQVYARHKSSFDEWVRLDIQYARSQSFLLDCKILLLTLPAVLSQRGAA